MHVWCTIQKYKDILHDENYLYGITLTPDMAFTFNTFRWLVLIFLIIKIQNLDSLTTVARLDIMGSIIWPQFMPQQQTHQLMCLLGL